MQAIEVFDENWLEWQGLDDAITAALGSVTPATNGGKRESSRARKLDVAATVGGMRHLRASIDVLPESQLEILRDECESMSRAIALTRKVPATR